MEVQDYVDGFDNGLFTKGVNLNSFNCSYIILMSAFQKRDDDSILMKVYLSSSSYAQWNNILELSTRKTIEKEVDGVTEKTVIEEKIPILKVWEKNNNVKFYKLEDKKSYKWFVVWGEGKENCYGYNPEY